jgi:hypothetical protein
MAARSRFLGFAVCVDDGGYPASLVTRRLYPVLADPKAEEHRLIRIVDESGEDYLYPAKLFRRLEIPVALARTLRAAS